MPKKLLIAFKINCGKKPVAQIEEVAVQVALPPDISADVNCMHWPKNCQ
jgi:hypothetical protein